MIINLKNGEVLNIEWNSLIFEKLELYEGGLEQLKKDAKNKVKKFHTINFVIFAVVSSNYSSELTQKQAVALVDPLDIEKIFEFIEENVEKMQQAYSR